MVKEKERENHIWCVIIDKSCKGTSVHILTLSPLLSHQLLLHPVHMYIHSYPCTNTNSRQLSISNSQWPLHIKVVDSRLLPPLIPQPHQTNIGYMGTRPHDTTAPSMSRGLTVRRGLEAWCCIEYYINVLGPSQGSLECSLWILPD
jgi:hypothetical protein